MNFKIILAAPSTVSFLYAVYFFLCIRCRTLKKSAKIVRSKNVCNCVINLPYFSIGHIYVKEGVIGLIFMLHGWGGVLM